MPKKNIVILGAGFGGLRTAMLTAEKLKKKQLSEKYDVILVDRTDCHLYTPLLYRLAAAPDHKPECTYDTTSLIKGLPIRFLQGEVASLDLLNGDIHLKSGDPVKTDYLVLALGSETNFFGIPGLKENSLQLKTAEQALEIRNALEAAFAVEGEIKIVIGGAGANGIELASEVKLWADEAMKENKKLTVNVSLLEATPSVLPGFDPRVQNVAAKRLALLGVNLMVNGKIVGVAPKEISLDGGVKIPFDIFVWTGGIRTPNILTELPVQKEPHGKPLAQTDMACLPGTPDLKLYPMIYGLGDSVCFMDQKTKRPVPAVARAAILQADVVAHNLIEEILKAESASRTIRPLTYTAEEYPYVIPIGANWAVAKFGSFVFSGWPAWTFAKLIEIHYLISIMPFGEAMQAWGKMG